MRECNVQRNEMTDKIWSSSFQDKYALNVLTQYSLKSILEFWGPKGIILRAQSLVIEPQNKVFETQNVILWDSKIKWFWDSKGGVLSLKICFLSDSKLIITRNVNALVWTRQQPLSSYRNTHPRSTRIWCVIWEVIISYYRYTGQQKRPFFHDSNETVDLT